MRSTRASASRSRRERAGGCVVFGVSLRESPAGDFAVVRWLFLLDGMRLLSARGGVGRGSRLASPRARAGT